MREDKLLIANAQGFWGDTSFAPLQLIEDVPLDYLTFDYLAEITMSILNKQKLRNPELGYAADFVTLVGQIIERCQKNNIKIIANAGGVNPVGCRDAIVKVIKSAGIRGVKVAVVEGDDILDQVDQLMEAGEVFSNLDTGEDVAAVKSRLTSANVYIGATPIVEALEQGADIVITGRASDPSLVLAPLIHEFGWSMDDSPNIAIVASVIVKHLIKRCSHIHRMFVLRQ